MGVGCHRPPCYGSTESELAFLQTFLEPPKPFLHQHIPTLYPFQMVENCSSPINVQGYERGIYSLIDIWISTTIFMSMAFNVHLIWMEEGWFGGFHPL